MSFFGFDPTQPPAGTRNDEAYDFENTYDGLGELEEDDAFNSETFGTSTNEIRKDFEFGHTDNNTGTGAGYQATPHASHTSTAAAAAAATATPQSTSISYAQAAQSAPVNDDEFMQELWGESNAPSKSAGVSTSAKGDSQSSERKVLSLEEIEAQLTAIDQSQMPNFAHQQPGSFPPQGYGVPGMMPPPPHIPPQHFNGYMMGGFIPPNQFGMPGMPPQPMPPMQPPIPSSQPLPHSQPVPPPPQQVQQQQQQQQQPLVSIQQENQQPRNAIKANEQNASQQARTKPQKVDLSQFPVLGSKEATQQQQLAQHQPQAQQPHYQQQQHQQQQQQQQHQNFLRGQENQQFDAHQQSPRHHHQRLQDLSPEERDKALKRQEKVSRIMRYSGIMNPKDKDFVTRFQLSQIVTEDPYNEDFYAQVYKVIHPKSANGTQLQAPAQQNNSIAQAYLDHSGHRLGGRYKRADVALQRMQQQVQKAVAVAKDRPKPNQLSKEGALGKISFASGKKPRQQLEIISKAAEREKENKSGNKGDDANSSSSNNNNKNNNNGSGSGIGAGDEDVRKYGRKDILGILENIISELMNVESESRTSVDIDTSKLWEAMKVLEQTSSSGDPESEVNPFVQCLNYNKMLKILMRLFKFLNREQILTIAALIMSNLENLSVIKNGSYTTYPDKKVPEKVLKLVDAYSLTFSKVLMNAVLEFKFSEIIGLIVILIEHNNVAFVSTTKIGLTILTTLLSRAELIIGEAQISATDLAEWSSCYDELFTALESRIAAIFPPNPIEVDDGSSRENYIWQFLATLSVGGKLSHQRIIVDELRDEIFGVMKRAREIDPRDMANLYKKQNLLNNLNMFLVVMGLVADENEIKEL
ncbi:DNA topoisomerase 2-associated protein pat1 [Lodderomyces elongisporus]|uniref:DNA topoisomerase 2-associated protein pat1 n=1 Tax=Lodderomyces elongisporus TaxID=36914 RepID=UPI00291F4D17|nr:DNA topoisomerase 2-associated protein pat1 [Lodderomyces elongisporus]WLF80396.1 DNA topoisomerase 2-associated protein pat1 [Lodderomyces elongisporus]